MRCRAIALGGWLLAASSLLWGQSGGAIRWLGIGAREHVGAVIDSPFVVGPASTRLWDPDSIRWTVVRPPAGYSDMELYDISWDGRVLSGWVREAASGKEFLIRLRRGDGGYEVTLPEWGAAYKVIFVAISGDGRICGGRMVQRSYGDTALFLWRGGDTLWTFESYNRAIPVDIFDLSWDGSIAVGRTKSLYYAVFPYPARYIYNPTRRQWEEQALTNLGGGATGVSADGRVIVGWIIDRAFRYTEQEGVRWLPGLPSSVENRAFAVSADGQIIVGSSQLRYAATSRAVRWVNGVVEDLNEVYGALLQDSSVLYDARAISPSGRYVIGTGYNGRTRQKEWYLLEFWGNNAPRAAYQVFPADSARVAPQPVLEMWGADIEQDSLRFVVELLQGTDTLRVTSGFVYDTARARLQVTLPDGWWRWRIRAVDRHGASSPWSPWRSFLVSPNQMPAFRVLGPEDTARYYRSDAVAFRFVAEDPDGDSVRVELRLERLGTPSEQRLWTQWAGSGDTLEYRLEGPHMPGEVRWQARVWDNRQGVSDWSAARLLEFVNRVPLLEPVSPPEDTLVSHPVWVCVRQEDPDGDKVHIELELQHAGQGGSVSWSSDSLYTPQQSIPCVSVGMPDSVAGTPTVQLPAEGTWLWRARARDEFGGVSEWTPTRRFHYRGVSVPDGQPVERVGLWVVEQGAGMVVRWRLAQPAPVRLELFDSYGRMVARLAEGVYGVGEHSTEVRMEVGSGVYWFRLIAGRTVALHPVVLLR